VGSFLTMEFIFVDIEKGEGFGYNRSSGPMGGGCPGPADSP